MKILLVAILLVFVIWVISLFIQRGERKARESRVKKRLKEQKKEAEKSQIPFRPPSSTFKTSSEGGEEKEAK